MLLDAHNDLTNFQNFNGKDSLVKNFLKMETSIKPGDPRNISPRTDRFLVILGPYISALEHQLSNHPNLVKGLNLVQRDSKMSTLLNFDTYIETDYSRFDMSISEPMLTEVQDYLLVHPFHEYDSHLFVQALQYARHTTGVNEIGIRYSVNGTRCSGDAHTSIANSLINHFNTWLALRSLPEGSWTSFHEGDDGVIALKSQYVDQACYNLNLLPCLGFQIKAAVYRSIESVSFCGRWFYVRNGVLKSICDLPRSLSKLHTTCHLGNPLALMFAKCLSYYHSDAHTPIIGAFITMFIRIYSDQIRERQHKRAINCLKRDYWFWLKHKDMKDIYNFKNIYREYVEPDGEARAMVALRTGITPAMQMAFEQYYKSFEKLGYLPDNYDKIPADWTFTDDSTYHGDRKSVV